MFCLLQRSRPQLGQGAKTQATEIDQPKPPVVGATFALVLHTPETHAYPAVQAAKEVTDMGKRGGEVSRRAPNDRVEFPNDRRVQVVVPGRQVANLGLEFL